MLRRGGGGTRGGGRARGSGRRPALLAFLLALLVLPGCATLGGAFGRAPAVHFPTDSPAFDPTLAPGDAWLRHHLLLGSPRAALETFDSIAAPQLGDDLVAALQKAVVLREAGDPEGSNELLEWAEEEVEKRSVTSVSRTVGSFVLNDRVRPYLPRPVEAAMLPFYRAMNHLELGDAEGAAIEARRLIARLDELGPSAARCSEGAMLRHFAALLFEAAGEVNDALVAARQAEVEQRACDGAAEPTGLAADLLRIAAAAGVSEVADSVRARYPEAVTEAPDAGGGELILFLERGFIAHRREAALHVPILEHEIEDLSSGDAGAIADATVEIVARLAHGFAERGYWGTSWNDRPLVQLGHALSGSHLLRLAWVEVEEPDRAPLVRLFAGADSAAAVSYGDLSRVTRAELEEERAAAITRLVARGLTKYLISREVERKAEKQGGELAGFLAGRLANLAANESERADTRGWTLLPDRIDVVRLHLPAGTHALRLETEPTDGGVAMVLELGEVEIRPGEIRVMSRRAVVPPLPAHGEDRAI